MIKWYLKELRSVLLRFYSALKTFKLRSQLAKRGVWMRGAVLNGDDYSKLIVGSNVWINDAFLDLHDSITIENNVSFGHQVKILTGSHDFKKLGSERGRVISKPVIIRTGAWIASFSVVLPGSEVGEHSVVAAGSVVRGVVPPYTLVAGNPAAPVRNFRPNSDGNPL